LEKGHSKYVKTKLINVDLRDKEALFGSLEKYKFDAIMHFAGYILAPESMTRVYDYLHNNIDGSLNLLEYCRLNNINKFIFSSTCAVYGDPKKLPITEAEPKKPESVYGYSKHAFERILRWYSKIYDIKYVNLRYFNASGASLDGSVGEDHDPETHLIPIALNCAYTGEPFNLYGTDYETEDGTCIRDYIHVVDLAEAHILALKRVFKVNKSESFNLGSGVGYSNKEVLKMVEKVTNKKLKVVIKDRRPGDPPSLYADSSKAKIVLGFDPKNSQLEGIIKSADAWYRKLNS
jgi:UDP-glucose 4-epimerase